MKTIAAIIALLFVGCSSGYETVTECYSTSQFRKFSSPSFSTYIMNVKAGDQSRADIYIQLPYRNVRFEKTTEGFKAAYSMTFIVRDNNNEIVTSKEIDRPITVKTYEETVSSRFDSHFQQFTLPPNDYRLEIIATDQLSRLRYTQREKITIKNYLDSTVVASTVLFLNTMLVTDKGISIRPIMPSSISLLTDSIGMFQELYHVKHNDTIMIRETYRRNYYHDGYENTLPFLMPPYRITSAMCNTGSDSVVYEKDSILIADRNGTYQLFQFYPIPPVGVSILERSIYVKREGRTDSARFSRNIFRRNKLSLTSASIGEVIAALRYIMREEEYDSVSVGNDDEKNLMINRFWENRGGIARRTDYEKKILEANALFTSCVEGSRTPMGIVYIVCGMPDYIECRGTFVETWYYNLGDRVFPIEFRRENEQSNLFELSPFSVNDSLWQYYIDLWRRKK